MLRFRNYNVSTIDKKFKMKPRSRGKHSFVKTIYPLNMDSFERGSNITEQEKKDSHLCRYVLPKKIKTVNHQDFMMSELFDFKDTSYSDTWMQYSCQNLKKIAWKLHIYSDNEADWQKICTILIPYLKDNDINWKTIGTAYEFFDILNSGKQKGKAITIYPHSNKEFAQISHDINFIIKNNNMQLKNSNISGDRQLGDSGRIFYRYEYMSKGAINSLFDLSRDTHYRIYTSLYEAHRKNGAYLARDMALKDDIWLYFNPDIHDADFID